MSNLDIEDLWNIPVVKNWNKPNSKGWEKYMKKKVFRERNTNTIRLEDGTEVERILKDSKIIKIEPVDRTKKTTKKKVGK
jgi:hypothetical protein